MVKIATELKKLSTGKEAMVFGFFGGRFQSVPTRLTRLTKSGNLVLKVKR
jgi:hypothetical protein